MILKSESEAITSLPQPEKPKPTNLLPEPFDPSTLDPNPYALNSEPCQHASESPDVLGWSRAKKDWRTAQKCEGSGFRGLGGPKA